MLKDQEIENLSQQITILQQKLAYIAGNYEQKEQINNDQLQIQVLILLLQKKT